MQAIAMLGDAREQPLFAKWVQAEAARTATECSEYGGEGCEDPVALARKRAEALTRYGKVLETAQSCGTEGNCWAQKLSDADPRLVERAALELGRGGAAQHAAALAGRLSEKDVEARLALIQALDWLLDSKETVARVREVLPKIQTQLADEKGNSRFVKVNEDLRRLATRLQKT